MLFENALFQKFKGKLHEILMNTALKRRLAKLLYANNKPTYAILTFF